MAVQYILTHFIIYTLIERYINILNTFKISAKIWFVFSISLSVAKMLFIFIKTEGRRNWTVV